MPNSNSNFTATIKGILDTSVVRQELDKIKNTNITFQNIRVDTAAMVSAVQDALDRANFTLNINQSNIRQQGNNIGRSFAEAIRSQINPDMLTPALGAIGDLRDRLSARGLENNAIDRIISGITANAQRAEIQITKINSSFQNAGQSAGQFSRIVTSGFDKFGNAVTITDTFNRLTGQLVNSQTSVTQYFDSITNSADRTRQSLENTLNINLSNGKFKADLAKLVSDINNLKTAFIPLNNSLRQLEDAFQVFSNPNVAMDARIAALQEYQSLLPGVRAQVTQLAAEESKAAAATKEARDAMALQDSRDTLFRKMQDELTALTPETEKFRSQIETLQGQIATADKSQLSHLKSQFDDVVASVNKEKDAVKEAANAHMTLTKSSTLSNNIQSWMNNNTAAAEKFGDELRNLMSQLNGNTDAKVLRDVNARFREIQSQAKIAGLSAGSFADSMKNIALQVTGLGSAVMVFRKIIQTIQEGVNTVVELDTALVDLQKTTTASGKELRDFYFEANDIAKEYGATTKDILQSAADWSRLGLKWK